MNEEKRIALLGGTFDPVHVGHLHLAGLARQALGLAEVWFVPCRISPHKPGTHPTPAADRATMLRLALADLPWARVEEHEIRRAGDEPSYSYATAEALCPPDAGVRWFWIMGADQWAALPRWGHPERLAARVEFIVFARGDEVMEPREGFVMHRVEGAHPASATAIREALRSGAGSHPWLPPAVAEWLRGHPVYQG